MELEFKNNSKIYHDGELIKDNRSYNNNDLSGINNQNKYNINISNYHKLNNLLHVKGSK